MGDIKDGQNRQPPIWQETARTARANALSDLGFRLFFGRQLLRMAAYPLWLSAATG